MPTRIGNLTNLNVARLYERVPRAAMDDFQAYLQAHPLQTAAVQGVEWSFVRSGRVSDALLMLPGALGTPDLSWRIVSRLEQSWQVIVPGYPTLDSMDALVEGIAGLLEAQGIEQAHVSGGSYGGLVAQVFVRRYPHKVRSLILSHSGPPDNSSAEATRKALRWLRWLPAPILRRLMDRMLSRLLPEETADTALMHAIYREMMEVQFTRAFALSSLRRAGDYHAMRFTPQDLVDWPGRILLVLSSDDRSTPPETRAALSALYPSAQVHLFEGAGHAASEVNPEEYLAVVEGFLRLDRF